MKVGDKVFVIKIWKDMPFGVDPTGKMYEWYHKICIITDIQYNSYTSADCYKLKPYKWIPKDKWEWSWSKYNLVLATRDNIIMAML